MEMEQQRYGPVLFLPTRSGLYLASGSLYTHLSQTHHMHASFLLNLFPNHRRKILQCNGQGSRAKFDMEYGERNGDYRHISRDRTLSY